MRLCLAATNGSEARITELFRSEGATERSFSVGQIADHAFALGGVPATRAQRLSTTRATHRIFRRLEKLRAQISAAEVEAEAQVSALGHKKPPERASYRPRWAEYFAARDATPAGIRARQLQDERDERFGKIVNWRQTLTSTSTTAVADGNAVVAIVAWDGLKCGVTETA